MNKETIKEFLKPDWRKIVLSVFLLWFPFCEEQIPFGDYPTLVCYHIIDKMFGFLAKPLCSMFYPTDTYCYLYSTGPIQIFHLQIPQYHLLLLLTLIVVEIISVYLFTCLIVSTYDRFRSKKQ